MSGTVVTLAFCADFASVFEVEGSRGDTYTVTWDGLSHATCTCKAFEYCKDEVKHCKHIDQTFKEGCFYNEQWYDGGTRELRPKFVTPNTIPGETCPKCGGPVIPMKCLV